MTLPQALESIVKFVFGTGLLVWLIRSIVTQLLARDLEKYKGELNATHVAEVEQLKADLRAAAFEHETRFARLHDKRTEIVAELYDRLAAVDSAFQHLTFGEDEEKKRVVDALERADAFFTYFAGKRIYFDSSLCSLIDQLNEEFRTAWISFVAHKKRSEAERIEEHNGTLAAELMENIATVRKEIEGHWRKMLGVSEARNTNPAAP